MKLFLSLACIIVGCVRGQFTIPDAIKGPAFVEYMTWSQEQVMANPACQATVTYEVKPDRAYVAEVCADVGTTSVGILTAFRLMLLNLGLDVDLSVIDIEEIIANPGGAINSCQAASLPGLNTTQGAGLCQMISLYSIMCSCRFTECMCLHRRDQLAQEIKDGNLEACEEYTSGWCGMQSLAIGESCGLIEDNINAYAANFGKGGLKPYKPCDLCGVSSTLAPLTLLSALLTAVSSFRT